MWSNSYFFIHVVSNPTPGIIVLKENELDTLVLYERSFVWHLKNKFKILS